MTTKEKLEVIKTSITLLKQEIPDLKIDVSLDNIPISELKQIAVDNNVELRYPGSFPRYWTSIEHEGYSIELNGTKLIATYQEQVESSGHISKI